MDNSIRMLLFVTLICHLVCSSGILAADGGGGGGDGGFEEYDQGNPPNPAILTPRLSRLESILELLAPDRNWNTDELALSTNDVMSKPVTSQAMDKRSESEGEDGEYVMGFWVPKKRGVPLRFDNKRSGPVSPYSDDLTSLGRKELIGQLDKRRSGYNYKRKRYPYRYIRRRSCDFTQLTTEHVLEYLRSGRICGRRVSHVRFGLTGRK